MKIKRFNLETDLKKLEDYLRSQYLENKNMTSWLPERLHDLIFRMDTQYTDAGKPKSSNYIFFELLTIFNRKFLEVCEKKLTFAPKAK